MALAQFFLDLARLLIGERDTGADQGAKENKEDRFMYHQVSRQPSGASFQQQICCRKFLNGAIFVDWRPNANAFEEPKRAQERSRARVLLLLT
jgi:hypothetical protein